jgi:hypothetical protein
MAQIDDPIYGDLIAYVSSYMLIGFDPTEGAAANVTKRLTLSNLLSFSLREGEMFNGKLSVTVASNNLTIAVKTWAGTDPTATDPAFVKINGTIRSITAATSCTIAAGTSFFNLGAVEFATLEQQLFAYAVYDSNSTIVAVSAARIPDGHLVSDFSATTTNEKHLYNYANFTSTDDVVNIGRFSVTNSGTASFNWSVPTFTSKNLIQYPVFETDWLSWTPTYSTSGSLTYASISTAFSKYKILPARVSWELRCTGTLGGSASNQILFTVPFEALQSANSVACGFGNTATVAGVFFITAGTPDKITVQKYDGSNYATSGASVINGEGTYEA